jgi:biopolymer transport protein ExbD
MNFRKYARSQEDSSHLIDMTALVDISFIIILFLGIVSTLAPLSSINVHLPEASSDKITREIAQIVIDKEGNYFVRDKQVNLEEIRRYLKKIKAKSVVIIADKRVPYGKVVKAIDVAKQAGVEEVNIATR